MTIFAGRGRWDRRYVAPTTTSRGRLDAHQVKAPPAAAFTVIVQAGSQPSQRIDVYRRCTHNGGFRLDFFCPACGRPARFLYEDFRGFRCRRCAGLRYPSSQAHHDQAAKPAVDRKLATVSARLRTTPDARTTPTRPPRMYRRTFFNLLIEWYMLRQLRDALLTRLLCGGLCTAQYESMGLDRSTVKQALAVAYQVREWRSVQRSRR